MRPWGNQFTVLSFRSPCTEAHIKGFENFKKTGSGPVIGKLIEVEAIRKDGGVFPVELFSFGSQDQRGLERGRSGEGHKWEENTRRKVKDKN